MACGENLREVPPVLKKWKFNISVCWRKKLIGSFRMVVDLVYKMMLARWIDRWKRSAQWWASLQLRETNYFNQEHASLVAFTDSFSGNYAENLQEIDSTLFARHNRAQRKSTRCYWRGVCCTQEELKVKSALIGYGWVSTSFYNDIDKSCIEVKGGSD